MELLETRTVFAAFTTGNLVVERIGDGAIALSNAAAPIALIEVNPSGTIAQSILFPASGADQQTDSGTATSNGYLNSFNGRLSVPGYDSASGTASVASLNTKVNSILDDTGLVASRTLFPTGGPSGTPPSPFSGNNFRSSIPTSSNTFYASGTSSGTPNTGGVWYYDGAAFNQISTTISNARNLEIYNNQLYVASAAGGFLGISSIGSGLPTTTGQVAAIQIDLGTGGSPYGFVMFDTNNDSVLDRAYIADDRANNANGGINRFDFNGTTWSRTAAFRLDTTTSKLSTAVTSVVSIRGLTGSYNSATGTATLYATTTEGSNNRLISLLDTSTAWSTSTSFITLQSAGTNSVFRGVDFAPDGTPPTISTLSPVDDAPNVAVESNLVATFNESISKGTGDILIRKTSDDSIAFTIDVTSGQVTVSGAVLTIDPPANLENSTEYYVQIPSTAVRDLAGNAFAGIADTSTWSFTTASGADTNPPSVTSLTPSDDATGVALNANLVVTFSENVLKGTGDILIRRSDDNAIVQTIDVASGAVTVAGDTVTINPPSDLLFLTGYYVQIPNTAFRDAASNFYLGISDTNSWNFTTINDTIPPTVVSMDDGDANNKVPVNTTLTYTIVFSEDIDAGTVDAADFNNEGTSEILIGTITETVPGTFTVQVTAITSGDLKLRIPGTATIADAVGNALVVPVSDNDTVQVFDDGTPPTVLSIADDRSGAAINSNLPIVFTITFSEEVATATVSALDFSNAGTASITVSSIAQATPGVVTLTVTPRSAGTLQLQIPVGAVIEDLAGNELVPPVLDDAVITVNAVTSLTAGDIAFTGIQTDAPDTFSFVLLKDVVDGTEIRFTDNRWSNSSNALATNENTLTLVFQNAGVGFAAGTHFVNVNGGAAPAFRVVGTSTSAGIVTSAINGLSVDGDSLLAYQGTAPTSGSSSAWIAGINTRSWSSGATNNETELPTALTNGVNAIQLTASTDIDNGAFQVATFVGSIAEIRSVVNNLKNWTTNDNIGPASTTTFSVVTTSADLYISEVIFDAVPATDTGEEYIELRGTPNTFLPGTAYLLLLDGDSEDEAGTVDHRFDLGGMQFGSNGFLVLRQFGSTYTVNANASVVTANSTGWGAPWSSRDIDIENGSVSVLLVLSSSTPTVGIDVDIDNNGNLDGDSSEWTIRDSIGNIDGGAADTGYGVLNTTGNGNGSVPTGSTLVNLGGYHPDYMARNGSSTGYALLNTTATDWVVGELSGAMPTISLATGAFTRPSAYAGAAINHLGAVNLFAPANSAPIDIALSSSSIAENAVANATVGVLSTTDPDVGNTFTYSFATGTGDTDNGAFNISGNALRATASFDFETKSSYTVRIRTTDQDGLFFEKAFTITVTNVNEGPTDIALSSSSIAENAGANATVGTLSTNDPDVGNTFTYSFATGTGDTDNGAFNISGNALRATASFDFETKSSYTVRIRTTDQDGLFFEKAFTITVTDVNESPVLTRSQTNVSGNVLTTFTNTGTWSDAEGNNVTLTASLGTVTKNADGTWDWSFVPSQIYTNQIVTITGNDGNSTSQVTFTIDSLAAVVNSKVYYKGSTFAGTSVDAALDTSKVIAKSGATAQALTFANLINTTVGINGLLFDVAGLAASSLTASDFALRMSPTGNFAAGANPPSSWAAAPAPTLIDVTAGNATTPARIRLEWANNAIENRWLQIKVLANANTGLVTPQVYYIGHLRGETNGLVEAGDAFRVRSTDVSLIVAAIGALNVPVTNVLDIFKDGRIRSSDSAPATAAVGTSLTRITIPVSGSPDEGEGGSDRSMIAAPGIELPKMGTNGDDRRLDPIRARWTDMIFDVPLPILPVSDGATATSKPVLSGGTESVSQGTSDLSLLSLDEYFERLGKERSTAMRVRRT